MSEALRRLVAIIVALAAGAGVVALVDAFANQMHPLPSGVDPTDMEALKLALENGAIPIAALVLMTSGWLLAAYVGGRIAARIGRWDGAVWIFAFIFTVGVYANLHALPHPTWMWIAGLGGCPLFALAAGGQTVTVPAAAVR